MKLRTTQNGSHDLIDATDENLIHDAAAAHALMQAIEAIMEEPETHEIIGLASELLREWGFDRGEDE